MTVVVCSRDRAEHLAKALPLVRAALSEEDQLVIVDSASVDGGTAAVAAAFGDVVREDVPGLSRARNAGLRVARHALVAFTDDDCRPEADWLDRIAAAFDDPAVAFVTGSVAPIEGSSGSASITRSAERAIFSRGADPAGIGHGANMAFRLDALHRVGGFDESLGAGSRLRSGEDKDMFLRLLEAGYAGAFEPTALIRHVQWRGHTELIRLRYGYGLGNGAFRAKAMRRHHREGGLLLVRGLWKDGVVGLYYALRHPNRGIFSVVSHLSGFFVGIGVVLVRGLGSPAPIESETEYTSS